ncbi:MAG: glycosyltransferase, partial [Desulfuromonadales bacterium]|nr:glycosyltransferase [Desulfuromonadales bacterium]
MRILHLIDSAGVYGAENVLLDLAAEQQEMGHRPVIASIGDKGIGEKGIEREAAARRLPAQAFRMRPGPNYPGALEVLRFAWREGIDLLHSHGYKGNILFGTIPRPWRRLPLLATLHGYTSLQRLTRMKIYESLDAWLLRHLDGVVLVDAAVRQHPRLRKCRQLRFQVVQNGIRLPAADRTPMLDPALVAFCQGGVTLGAIGRLSPEKGICNLIEALHRGGEAASGVRLLIIGEGGERQRLEEQIAACRLQQRVVLAGYRPFARGYLPLLAGFVLPSLTEGLPITVLEAMQAGVPILASRVGAVPELLEQGRAGLLVTPGAIDELTAGILTLRQQPQLARSLAERGCQRVSERYSSRRMALQYERIY